jgi:hypothetical protein
MGVRHANGAKGDLIAEVQIVLPARTKREPEPTEGDGA